MTTVLDRIVASKREEIALVKKRRDMDSLKAAVGGALAGVIIAVLSYGWLCALSAIPITYVALIAGKQIFKSRV